MNLFYYLLGVLTGLVIGLLFFFWVRSWLPEYEQQIEDDFMEKHGE